MWFEQCVRLFFVLFEIAIDWNTMEAILVVWKLHAAFHTRSMHNIL